MKSLRARAVQGLEVGAQLRVTRCFTDEDIRCFAQLSRDYNPVHYDAASAELRRFRSIISHGLLTASLVTEIGGQIGWLATSMSFEFKRPVYAGDAITCHWLIVDKDERGHARAQLSIVNAQGETVLEGMTTGVLPNAAARERMAQLLAEGDPGNLAAAGA